MWRRYGFRTKLRFSSKCNIVHYEKEWSEFALPVHCWCKSRGHLCTSDREVHENFNWFDTMSSRLVPFCRQNLLQICVFSTEKIHDLSPQTNGMVFKTSFALLWEISPSFLTPKLGARLWRPFTLSIQDSGNESNRNGRGNKFFFTSWDHVGIKEIFSFLCKRRHRIARELANDTEVCFPFALP